MTKKFYEVKKYRAVFGRKYRSRIKEGAAMVANRALITIHTQSASGLL